LSEAANPGILRELMLVMGVGVVLFWLIPSLVWVYEILSRVDLPSLVMVLAFTTNIAISFYDPMDLVFDRSTPTPS